MTVPALITVKVELFDEKGERLNIECFSLPAHTLFPLSSEFLINWEQCLQRTKQEILTPTPKTDMA